MGKSKSPFAVGFRESLERISDNVRQPKSVALILLVALTIGFGAYTFRRIWTHGKNSTVFQFNLSQLRPTEPMPWIRSGVLAATFASDPFLSQPHSIFDAGIAEEIAQTLEAIPWVARVPQVRKSMPNKIALEIVPREPLVRIVGYGDGRMLADIEGVRIDESYYDLSQSGLVLFEVTGVSGSAPLLGQAWADDAVRAAASVARVLKQWRYYATTVSVYGNDVVAIDVSNFRRRSEANNTNEITLITRLGNRIKWGFSPMNADHRELSVDEKLRWLFQIYSEVSAQKFSSFDIRSKNFLGAQS